MLAGKKVDFYMYADAQHAFMNQSKERYHKPSADLAFQRVIEFLANL